MGKKSIIPKLSKEVLRKRGKDPDLPEFQPSLRGKTHSVKEIIEKEEEREK